MLIQFNGYELTDKFAVTDISRPVPGVSTETEDVSGADGTVLLGARRMAGSVSFRLWPRPSKPHELRKIVREAAAALSVTEPAMLSFSDDDGLYYMAVPTDAMSVTEYVDTSPIDCRFIVPECALYGKQASVTVPSGGSVAFNVGGTYRTSPVIEAPAAAKASGSFWRLRLDSGDFLALAFDASSHDVRIDCGTRVATVDGATALPTLQSDWLELEPGEHVLSNDMGSGECTVTWNERWL